MCILRVIFHPYVQNSHRRAAENYTLEVATFLVQGQSLNHVKSVLWQIWVSMTILLEWKLRAKILRHFWCKFCHWILRIQEFSLRKTLLSSLYSFYNTDKQHYSHKGLKKQSSLKEYTCVASYSGLWEREKPNHFMCSSILEKLPQN